jgi:type II secretory ATPase GspE/PulE/Tfp pilus assembly ATPase PilB-like protein
MKKKLKKIMKKADEPSVRNLLNLTLLQVIKDHGQSFELHPSGHRLIEIVYGKERELRSLPKEYYESVVSRIEIMADMQPLVESPQRGKISLAIAGDEYLLSIYTEKILDGKYVRADIEIL